MIARLLFAFGMVGALLLPGCASRQADEECPPSSFTGCEVLASYFVHIHDVDLVAPSDGGVVATLSLTEVKGQEIVVESLILISNGGSNSSVYPGNLSAYETKVLSLRMDSGNR